MIFVIFADTRLVIWTVQLQVSMKLCPLKAMFCNIKTLKGDYSKEWVVIGLYRIPRPFLNTFFKIVETFCKIKTLFWFFCQSTGLIFQNC